MLHDSVRLQHLATLLPWSWLLEMSPRAGSLVFLATPIPHRRCRATSPTPTAPCMINTKRQRREASHDATLGDLLSLNRAIGNTMTISPPP
ncbi:hypothetical protein J3E69DRAFT_363420 [Trichoderma sp. SZMC 28015]